MSNDFKDAPRSIGELRSDRSSSARDWTPRDVLVSLLRELDSGTIRADALVVVYRNTARPGVVVTGFSAASPDIHTTLGMLEAVKPDLFAAE